MMQGVDYSVDHPSATGLVAEGKSFACRYVGPGSADKLLDRPEAGTLELAGLQIVSLVEGAEFDPLDGWNRGVEHATLAREWHAAREFPWPVPLYFAVDFDVQGSEWPAVREYLKGAASVVGLQWTGVYGGIRAMQWARADDVARWFFQTYAWSGGVWAAGNNMEQYLNGVELAGGTVDLDRAPANNPGVWNVTSPTPPPTERTISQADVNAIWAYDPGKPGGPNAAVLIQTQIAADAATNTEAALSPKLDEILTAVQAEAPTVDLTVIVAKLDHIINLIDGVEQAPPVDAVAVAKALIGDAGFVQALGAAVAAQLSAIVGEITLSGTLAAGVKPPAS